MPSNAEVRKSRRSEKRNRRSTAAKFLGAAMAIVLALLPNRAQWVVIAGLSLAALFFIYAIEQSDWVSESDIPIKRWTRFAIGAFSVIASDLVLGVAIWPPKHRHVLSQKERSEFEAPLKANHSEMAIHFYCAPEDEVDCEYATDLIPLFGEAGWDVANTVDRVTLGRPKSGILIGLHGTVKPEDEPKLKWNEGEWTRVRPEMWMVRQAFVNIGIEPESTSGGTVPENQINIYVGHEREDETAPTGMTQAFENFGPGAKRDK
jgi:hypothetical protein